jgi:hypothetical protein
MLFGANHHHVRYKEENLQWHILIQPPEYDNQYHTKRVKKVQYISEFIESQTVLPYGDTRVSVEPQ